MFLDLLSSMKLFLKCLTVVSNLEETFERGQVWLRVERIFLLSNYVFVSWWFINAAEQKKELKTKPLLHLGDTGSSF